MENDIVPALLETIEKEFDTRTYNSKKLKKALKLLEAKKANYIDVNDFAVELGEILADVFRSNLTGAVLPDGKMYFNIAERIINTTLKKNHELITNFAADVQTELNHAANLRIKGQVPTFNQDRADGIINRISSENDFEAAKWILDDPIVNFCQSIVDDTAKANADFHFNAGLSPVITRRVAGHACDWCKNIAGTYEYHKEPSDVYRRHERCRCTVEYNPKDSRGIQNAHSKAWRKQRQQERIKQRKTINLKK